MNQRNLKSRFSIFALAMFACALSIFTGDTAAQTLRADYQFQNTRSSSVAGAPDLTDIAAGNTFTTATVNGQPRTVLQFPAGSGLQLQPTTGLISNNAYNITMQFEFDVTSGYRRVLDWVNVSEHGVYILSNKLIYYTTSANIIEGITTLSPDTYYEIEITRTPAGQFKAYVNGVLQFTFNDPDNQTAITAANTLRFFKDNGGEDSSGSVARIRLYDSAEYNPRDEFALVQGGANGLWNYGYSTSDADNTLNLFNAATDTDTISSGCGGIFERWRIANAETVPQIARHNPATTCSNIPSNAVFIHPGKNNQRAVLRFNAPVGGTFQITGSLQKQVSGATTDLKIIKNGGLPGETVLYTGTIGAVYQQSFNFTATIAAGDKIDFSLGDDGDNTWQGDSSTLAVTIGQPVTTCSVAPANLQVNVPAENSPSDVQSVNTNAALVGDAAYTNTGKVGRAFEFDGNGDYVRIEDNAAQKPVNQLTVEGWFNLSSVTNQSLPHLVSKPLRNSAENSYALWYNGSLRIGYKPTGSSFTEYATGYQPSLNVWNHYAFVLNTDDAGEGANTAKLYVNGIEVFSGTATNPIYYNGINDALAPYPLLIGAEFESNNSQWGMQGQADEVSIYGRALSQTEIFNLVKQGNFGKCPPVTCVQSPNNLVSWFAGEQNALDSRSNNHGTNIGVDYTAGRVGQAFFFDSDTDRIQTNTNFNQPYQQLSVEAWVNPTLHGSGDGTFGRRVVSNTQTDGFALAVFNGYLLADYRLSDGNRRVVASTNQLPLNQWSHIAMTYDGAAIKGYVNGIEVFSQSATGTIKTSLNSTSCLMIGNDPGAGCVLGTDPGDSWRGGIDEPAIYTRGLSSVEIQSIYNAGQSGKCKPAPLNPAANQIAWFSGDGDTRDFLGANPNGILRGDANFRVGKVGQAFNLDGSGDYVEVADDADHRPATQLTAEGWFKINSLGNSPHLIAKGLRGNDRNSYVIWFGNGNIRIGYADSSTNFIFYDTGFVPNIGEFNHYAMVLNTDDAGANANTFKLYVNGREVISGAAAGAIYYDTVNPHPLTIGADINNDVPDFSLNGRADEVSLYSRALSASEIAAIYNAGTAGKLKSVITPVNFADAETRGRGDARIQNVTSSKFAASQFAPTVVQLADAAVTLRQVTTDGTTSQNNVDLGGLPKLPSSATFTGLAYDLSTTATYQNGAADDVKVCFNLPSLAVIGANNLRVLHLEAGAWIDRTAAGNTLSNFCTDNLPSLSPFVIVRAAAPTAAEVSISGRVIVGRKGLRNAMITLTEANGSTRTILSGINGSYRFGNIAAGQTVVLSIRAKRYNFPATTQVLDLTEDVENMDFNAVNGF